MIGVVVPFQRSDPSGSPELRQSLARDLAALADGPLDGREHARLLGRIGEAYRMLGQADVALPYLEQALLLSRRLDDSPGVTANLIRLATLLQYGGRHEEAESLFQEALQLSRHEDCRDYQDFALQHLGKCLVEVGRLSEAIALFEQALALRRRKGDRGLIASTESALAAARALVAPSAES